MRKCPEEPETLALSGKADERAPDIGLQATFYSLAIKICTSVKLLSDFDWEEEAW